MSLLRVQTLTHKHQLPVSGRLHLGVRVWLGVSRARRLPGQGWAAPTVEARGAAAGGDVAAVATAGGGEGGSSGHSETRGTPTLQDRDGWVTETVMWVAVVTFVAGMYTHIQSIYRTDQILIDHCQQQLLFPSEPRLEVFKTLWEKQNNLTMLT